MGNIEVTNSDDGQGQFPEAPKPENVKVPTFLFFPDDPGPEPVDALRHVQHWAETAEADHQRHLADRRQDHDTAEAVSQVPQWDRRARPDTHEQPGTQAAS